MLALHPGMRVFAAREPTDMRKGFDGLCGLVCGVIDQDPQSGHLFVFCNRSRNRVKILMWDGSGYLLLYKRIDHGRFHLYDKYSEATGCFELNPTDLTLILEGIDLRGAKRRPKREEVLSRLHGA
ncbi:MAG: IS66 family insertion sequence element accessory protein TnpB [Planctomycetes bacterium]|nr:IS66 family insertion sequence element accessory protein TnpB [Planctomycetota bacterium]